jgi:alanine-synthesizing transaminase
MRNDIVAFGADELKYEIREIVSVAKNFEKLGIPISWENIGDPVQKGEKIPQWIKNYVKEAVDIDETYAYCPTKGVEETREFLANETNKKGNVKITKEDIIFFNGLGDAIGVIYKLLNEKCRVIGPSPGYETHSSLEAAHAGSEYISYSLNPKNHWYPDVFDLKQKVKYNKSISGILMINPDNPTGAVYPKETLEEIVKIAKKYDLFMITDEIYTNIAYNETKATQLNEVIDDVCGISMKGISKEFPWPGARCGWIEIYNPKKDENFDKYVKGIFNSKMTEVCATTLPQSVIPSIISDERYDPHIKSRNKMFEKRSNTAYGFLKDLEGTIVNKTNGAFYMTVVFEDEALNEMQNLNPLNENSKNYLEKIIKNVPLDKRFVYNLLASTGICVVPLTSFNCNQNGFRITLLETDEKKFEWIFTTVRDKITEYLNSA